MGLVVSWMAKLYCGFDGTYGLELSEISIAKDVKTSADLMPHEVTARGHNGFRAFIPTLSEETFEFQINKDTDNEVYLTLEGLYDSRTPAYFASLDGEVGVGDGRIMWGEIFSFNETHALDGVIVVDVIVKVSGQPTINGNVFVPGKMSVLFPEFYA